MTNCTKLVGRGATQELTRPPSCSDYLLSHFHSLAKRLPKAAAQLTSSVAMLGRRVSLCLLLMVVSINLSAQNPIVPNQGLNDPHIHIFNDTAYVYASHDKSADNKKFTMEDWWVWSSPDLVNWTQRSVLKPEDTYIGGNFDRCWATDVGRKNGKYYWYFSEGNQQSGVVEGPTPTGPWTDKLGKPLLSENLTPTDEYDMAIFEETGQHWIIFGVWDYYIARLGEDMMSLAETPLN